VTASCSIDLGCSMTGNIIVDLRSPRAQSSLHCGNKSAWLATLLSEGVMVPRGFVVTNEAFSSTHPRTLEEAVSVKLKQYSTDPSALWAVRASPLQKEKWATSQTKTDQSLTRLAVSTAEVPAAIRQVWSSAALQGAVPDGSRVEPPAFPVAVLVQELVRPSAAGLCFTAESMRREDKIFVYANYGLGESIAGRAVVPDTHIVDRDTLEPIMDIIGSKTAQIVPSSRGLAETGVSQDQQKRFCLSPADVAAVAELAKSIEARMGRPVRVEWAFEEGTLYVVDARRVR